MIDFMLLPERFRSKVLIADNGCWLWQASLSRGGYAQYAPSGREGGMARAHCYSYRLLVGPIPEGLELDHVRERGCLHRHCVNPAHLEPVTHIENLRRGDSPSSINARKTHCPRGHPLSGDNLFVDTNGARNCRICQRAAGRRARQKRLERNR